MIFYDWKAVNKEVLYRKQESTDKDESIDKDATGICNANVKNRYFGKGFYNCKLGINRNKEIKKSMIWNVWSLAYNSEISNLFKI